MRRLILSLLLMMVSPAVCLAQWPQFVQDAHDEAAGAWQAAAFVSVEIVPFSQTEADDAKAGALAQRPLCTDPTALQEGDEKMDDGEHDWDDGEDNKNEGRNWHDDANILHQAAVIAANAGDFNTAVAKWQESKFNSERALDALELAEDLYGDAAMNWSEAESIFWEGTPGNGAGGGTPPQ